MNPTVIQDLFVKYYNEAILYAVSLCRNEAVAEDIVSAAFYKALTSADNEIRNFKPWLFTVCRNEFFSLCRKNKAISYEELSDELPDYNEEIVESLILKEEYRELYRALDKLRASQRETIMLFYFSGLQIRDIAAITSRSESNVKVLLFRGRERLKELMGIAE